MEASRRSRIIAIGILSLMLASPLAAADYSHWSGPGAVGSSGGAVTVDGWDVPGNGTILDSWMLVGEDAMPSLGNGSSWDDSTAGANFTSGTFTRTTAQHFGNMLSLSPNGSYGNVDSFNSAPSYQLAAGMTGGGTGVAWTPSALNYSGTPAPNGGNTVANGTIPANATEGGLVVGTNPNGGVPVGSNAWLTGTAFTLPSPISNFTFEFDHWYHVHTPSNVNGDMDGVWLEYKLDNGSWTWLEPESGYNNTISPNATVPSGANQSGNGSHGFPVWAKTTYSGWEHSVFGLDNLTGINNATNINFRFRIWTDQNSTVRPGWFIDNITVQNIGAGMGYWHHGCYGTSSTTGNCLYSNNAIGALQLNQPINMSGVAGNSILRTRLEWDLEGSGWDNFCVELSLNNTTWSDISSTGSATTTACRSRAGAIPGSGYTIGGTTYGDETNGFVNLDLAIPTAFHNQSTVYLRYRVDTDSSVQYGGTPDSQEGLTLDRIQVLSGAANNSTVYFDDQLTSSSTAFHYGIGTLIEDWVYLIIGQGGLLETYGFEDSPSFPPGGWTVGNTGNGDVWEYGFVSNANGAGPASWPFGNYGFGVDLDGGYDGSEETHLFTPTYTIPNGASARLTFDHWRCAEDGWDGGAVFIKVNNGNWTYFDPAQANGTSWYDGAITFGSHALSNLDVFDGRQFTAAGGFSCQGAGTAIPWETETADLATYTGSSLQFRFTFASDTVISYDGWYLDEIGVEVDYFESQGSWISPAVNVDALGLGFIDIDADIPSGTWVSGSVTDAGGIALDGYENLDFPISLAGIDRDTHQSVRLQIHMGTNDPFISPTVRHLHYGSLRMFESQEYIPNGWNIDPALQFISGNWTNNGSTPATIISPFVPSTAPIQYINFSGQGQGVTTAITDSNDAIADTGGLTSMLNFSSREPGFGVRYTISPGGHLEWSTATGDMVQPSLNPSVDVTDNGGVDWEFPYSGYFGHYGWQSLIHSEAGTLLSADSTTASLVADSNGESIEVLIPADATTTSGIVAIHIPGPLSSGLEMTAESSAAHFWSPFSGASGILYAPLSNAMLNSINSAQPSWTDSSTGRQYRQVDFEFTSAQSQPLDILSVTVGYSITENVTDLTQQLYDYHANQLAGSIPPSIAIPVTVQSDAGALVLGGSIYHEQMITNLPFSVPTTFYPSGEIYEIVTRHHHLNDNSLVDRIVLIGNGSDGNDVHFEATDLGSGGTFSQVWGSMRAPLDISSSVSEVNGNWEVRWRFDVTWLWDDVDQIDWMVRGLNQTGDGLSPAFATSGGLGVSAVENDLEIDLFEVRDQFDRLIPINPNQEFYVQGGSDLALSGTVRFQNTVHERPKTNDYSVGVNFSGIDSVLSSLDNGSFSGTLTVPNGSSTVFTVIPRIVRVGPPSGTNNAVDNTAPSDTLEVVSDNLPPVAGDLQVLTSNGLLDANGYVWEPFSALSLRVTLNDPEALGEEVALHYWREGMDDTNQDGTPDVDEYQTTMQQLSMAGTSNEQTVLFDSFSVSEVPSNGDVSLWIEGTDWAGHQYVDSGSPGLDEDKATVVIGVGTPTSLDTSTLSLNTVGDYLLAGQQHTISMQVEDTNGIRTLDDIIVFLTGAPSAPIGELHFDPREQVLTGAQNSFLTPISGSITEVSESISLVEITFVVDWDFPNAFSNNWMMPAVQIIDDTHIVVSENNIGTLRWKLDHQLTADVSMLHDLTDPLSQSDPVRLYLGKGDMFAITGTVVYAGSGTPLPEIPDGLQLFAVMSANGVTESRTINLAQAEFNLSMSVPVGYPSLNALPVTIDILNIPGAVTSVPNLDISLSIDSTPPVLEFAPGILTAVETDRLDSVLVRVNVIEVGGMPENEGLIVRWVYLRGVLPIVDSGGFHVIPLESHIGDIWTYSGDVNLTPPADVTLQSGDQLAIWLEGHDLAGNEMFGDGTADTPRAPQLLIRVFDPQVDKFEVSPEKPQVNEDVVIKVTLRNVGTSMGTVNVTFLEELDNGQHQIYDSQWVANMTPGQKQELTFTWQAWDTGKPDLYIMLNDDEGNMIAVDPQIDVQKEEGSGGLMGTEASVGLVVLLLGIILLGSIIAVAAVMMRQREDWDDEDAWEEAEAIATEMLDSVPEAASSPSAPIPADAPLPEQTPPAVEPESADDWIISAREQLPGWDDDILLGYHEDGWSIEQLVAYREENPPEPIPVDAPQPGETPPDDEPESTADWLSLAREQLPGWPDDTLLNYRENGWSVAQLVAFRDENQ